MATISCTKFAQYLVDQQPVYDRLILADIRPTDSWVLNVATGTFDAFSGVEHTLDRFRHVFPNTTKVWNRTTYANCVGTPCDKTEHCIGWGATRITYYLEEQSWQTPLVVLRPGDARRQGAGTFPSDHLGHPAAGHDGHHVQLPSQAGAPVRGQEVHRQPGDDGVHVRLDGCGRRGNLLRHVGQSGDGVQAGSADVAEPVRAADAPWVMPERIRSRKRRHTSNS